MLGSVSIFGNKDECLKVGKINHYLIGPSTVSKITFLYFKQMSKSFQNPCLSWWASYSIDLKVKNVQSFGVPMYTSTSYVIDKYLFACGSLRFYSFTIPSLLRFISYTGSFKEMKEKFEMFLKLLYFRFKTLGAEKNERI